MNAGWDHPATVQAWLAFNRAHRRYRRANAALAAEAALAPGHRVLDLGAGTGGTARALLCRLGPQGRVDCVEPALAMREAGRRALRDPRVRWLPGLEDCGEGYDRIVCGAALWQAPRPRALLRSLAARLAGGGALCFNIPAAYLGEPDAPGGGADPWLTQGLAALATLAPAMRAAPMRPPWRLRRTDDWLRDLRLAGLWPQLARHRQRLAQSELRDWLKLPPLTPRLPAARRAALVDAAFAQADPASWRWETWCHFTAFKPALPVAPLPARAGMATALREGCWLHRGALNKDLAAALQHAAQQQAQALGLVDAAGRWCGEALDSLAEHPPWLAWQARMAARPELAAVHRQVLSWPWWPRWLGGSPRADRGTVFRLAPPAAQVPPTPPHRDADYIREAQDLWTVWIALADTPLTLGPLAVVHGSHRDALLAAPWRAAGLQAGDALVFHARTLHRALPNLRPDAVRWSLDLRVSLC